MSRTMLAVTIVVLASGFLLVGYEILSSRMGLPSVFGFLFLLWTDITAGVGSLEAETKGWLTVIIAGFVVLLLIARTPKLRKY
jgi:hypothetical protein